MVCKQAQYKKQNLFIKGKGLLCGGNMQKTVNIIYISKYILITYTFQPNNKLK